MEEFSRTPTGRPTKRALTTAIADRAAERSGVIGYDDLAAFGLSTTAIHRRVDNGELHPRTRPRAAPRNRPAPPASARDRIGPYLLRGAYSLHPGPLPLNGVRWAAILGGPTGSHLARISAAAAHGLERPHSGALHVVAVHSGWRGPRGVVPHCTRRLPMSERTLVQGVPCTSVARTLLDCTTSVDTPTLDDLLDKAIDLRIYDEADFRRVIKHWSATTESKLLDAALDRLDEKSGEFRSAFERRTTRLVETSTLIPSPVVNVLAEGFRPDLHFLGTRAILECDGRDYHRSMAQILADEQREEILLSRGYRIRRIRWAQLVYEPERTLAMIERFVLENLAPPVA